LPGNIGQLFFISVSRVAVHTLGCKLNFAETSTIAGQFKAQGYEVVTIDDVADVCVINTCSVTERADRECRQMVRRALRHSPNAYIIVAGCYAQLRPDEIAAIPGVDLVLGTQEKFHLFEYAKGFQKESKPVMMVGPVSSMKEADMASSIGLSDRTRAFLKIQDGCDYSCAFCTIPLARGTSRSVSVEDVVLGAKEAVQAGYREIVLTGVNVGDYGHNDGKNLRELLGQLVEIQGLDRIRISSIEPNLLTDELLALWATNPKLCRHFHVPLQGGNDDLLKLMRRRYLTDLYADRVSTVHRLFPTAGIGADVIVGFPGETEEVFSSTYRFLVDLPISYLHVFTYSERPNTPAQSFDGRVEPRIRAERSEMLRILSSRKRQVFHESFKDAVVDVLFEDKSANGCWTGLTGEYVRVRTASTDVLTNQIRKVKIHSTEGDECTGKLVDTRFGIEPMVHLNPMEVSLCK
jgi:threonylcarbamoyladenosine tRNA methylthiotransferase MtaB